MIGSQLWGIPVIYYLIAVAFLLPRIPVVGKFFNIINTLVHEFGHALFALLCNGQVMKIQIFSDTSGVTVTKSRSTFASVIVSMAGYPFASLAAFVCFFTLKAGYEQGLVLALSILFLFMLILWIRNIYGVIWVVLFLSINALLIFYFKKTDYIQLAAWFYSLMILIESVWSTLVLLFLSIKNKSQAGDATNLAKFTRIPAVVWALLFTAFAAFMAYEVIALFI